MTEPAMQCSRGDGVDLKLAIWEGTGRTIICIHGLTANCRCWDLIAGRLAPQYRILTYDLRGRGGSDKPASGYCEAQHVKDLKCLMDEQALPRAILMGHSLGAYIALQFAATYPERSEGLILLDGGGELSSEQWDRVTQAIEPSIARLDLTFPSANAFLDRMRQLPFLQPWTREMETYFRYDLEEVAEGIRSRIKAAHIREEMANKRQAGAAPFYPRLRCPVLILRATQGILRADDILLPDEVVKGMLAEIPDASLVDIEGTHHYSILFQPHARRDEEIARFLAQAR